MKNSHYRKFHCITLALFLVLASNSGTAQNQASPITVGPEIDGFIGTDGSGFFLEISRLVTAAAGYDLNYQTRPLARAVKEFSEKSFECYLGADKYSFELELGTRLDLIESEPLYREEVVAMTLKGNPRISSYADLNAKSIGMLLGENAESFGLSAYQDSIVEVRDLDILAEMLRRGRIDVAIDYAGFYDESASPFHFDNKFVLQRVNHNINCYRSPQSLIFIQKINAAHDRLKKTTAIETILNRYSDYF